MVKRESMTNSNKKDRHGGIFKGERVYPKPKWKGDRMNLFWRGKNMSISYWSLGQSWHDGQKRKKSCQTEGERGENDRAAHWSWRRKRKPGLGLLFMPSKTVLQWLHVPKGDKVMAVKSSKKTERQSERRQSSWLGSPHPPQPSCTPSPQGSPHPFHPPKTHWVNSCG